MIIGIDGNEINIERRVGVNVYGFELLWSLWKLQEEWGSKHHLIVYLKEKPRSDMPKEMQNFKYKIIPGGGMWVLTRLMPDLFFGRPRPDIFFSPSHYTAPFAPMPRIVSIMDLGYLESSGQFTKIVFWQLKWWSAISIIVSKRIIAISNATKSDIVRHYPFAKDKVYVTQLAYDRDVPDIHVSPDDVRRVKNKYSIVTNYVLYVGTLKPSKNVEGLIDAFCKVKTEFPDIQLVIAGKKGWLYEPLFEKVNALKLEGSVVFTDYVSDKEKAALRRGARVFVQPSFWEGFGIDTLSAMAVGVPVVVSNTGSLPEIVGDAAIQVDPYNAGNMASGIKKVLSMSKTDYNKLVAKGLRQAAKFSWEKTARATLRVLEGTNV